MLGWFGFMQSSLGPLMPFLRDELSFDYSVSGLHLAMYALGIVVSGLVGDHAARRYGRPAVFWGGAFGMACGGVVLILGRSAFTTVPGAFLMGAMGGMLLMAIQAALADRHAAWRTIALTEANMLAGIIASCSPLLIGGFQRAGWGWRGAIVCAVALVGVAAIAVGRDSVPAQTGRPDDTASTDGPRNGAESAEDEPVGHESRSTAQSTSPGRLPRAFWSWWLVMFLVMGVETSMLAWSAVYLESAVGLEKSAAALLVAVFFGAMAVGRMVGARLSRSMSPERLLAGAFAVALVGFPVFWLPRTPAVAVVGLTLCGLGIANFYPLTLTMAVGASPGQSDAASARILSAVGLAGLSVPLAVGIAADRSSLFASFCIVATVLLLAAAMAWNARQSASGT